MSHSCRAIGAFAHAINFGFGSVLNRTRTTAAALLLASAAAPGVAFAQSGPTKDEATFFDKQVTNPCTGETVLLTGTIDTFIYLKVKNSGAQDLTVRIKTNGTGTALLTGATYTFNSDETTRFNDLPLGSADLAMMTKTMLVRKDAAIQGSEDDWMFKETSRLKLAESGAILIDREVLTQTCN